MVSILQIHVLKFQKSHITYQKSLIPPLQTTAHVSYSKILTFQIKAIHGGSHDLLRYRWTFSYKFLILTTRKVT